MHSKEPMTCTFYRTILGAGALAAALLLVPACSDSTTPGPAAKPATTATTTAPKNPTEKVADSAASAPKKSADAASNAAMKKAPDQADAATQAAGKVAMKPDMKSAADKAAPAAMKPADAAKTPDTKTATAPTPALKTPEEVAKETQKAAADLKAAAAKGNVDPTQDTDPNSKAKISYEFGSDTKNFGKVMQGDVLNHHFTMKSSGEEDLVIKQAKPTCGCTVAQIMVEETDGSLVPYQYGKPIPPGRKVDISATLHTQNKRGHAGSKINIFTNDPRGQTILGLEADVDPFFNVNPPSINFNTLSQKDTATDKLTVTTSQGQRVKLAAVKDNMPQGLKLDLNALDADADGKATRWELVATAGPGLTEGNLAFAVPMRSDFAIPGGEKMPNGQAPTYEVQATIMARVTGAISYNPQFVSLGLIRPGQTLSRSVRITCHDNDFKLTEPKVAIQGRDTVEWEFAKYFTPVVRPVAGENAVDVEVTLNGMPESLSGSFSGMLLVQIGHPEKPEIKIPITGVCRGGSTGQPGEAPAGQQPVNPPK